MAILFYYFINQLLLFSFFFTSICSREAMDVFFGSSINIAPAPKDWIASLNLSIVRSDNLVTTQRLVNMSEVMGRASMFTSELREPGTEIHVNLFSIIVDVLWVQQTLTSCCFEGNSTNLKGNVLIYSLLEAAFILPFTFSRASYQVSKLSFCKFWFSRNFTHKTSTKQRLAVLLKSTSLRELKFYRQIWHDDKVHYFSVE